MSGARRVIGLATLVAGGGFACGLALGLMLLQA